MREGSLDAPTRHPIEWQSEDFYDEAKLDAEMHRIFDICHGCRRCFNLCDSFPRLFDLIDNSPTGELDSVDSKDFKQVVDACTLCDMCFMTKCPYVPPHEFNLDFPHLMLRYRAANARKTGVPFYDKQLAQTDRNGKLAGTVAPIANWATDVGNGLTRPILEKVAGVHREARLPDFHNKTFALQSKNVALPANREAPGFGRKAVLYATCFVNYNNPGIGMAARRVLALNGVETEVVYPACCGMPQLEQGEIAKVAENAKKVSQALKPWIDKGYDVIALVPSCSLMLKFEWPLILPGDEDVKLLSKATFDVSEYIVDIAKKNGLAPGLKPLEGGVTVHLACHARAQNMGPKAAELLRLIPDTKISVIERCSGHGGSWGVKKEWFEVALKIGKPVARQAAKNGHPHVVSECPLAGEHIVQGMEKLNDSDAQVPAHSRHPVELLARAYGLE
ncbi:MAG: ferredoxin [Alphaproteobacteria bacterium]|jgi:glycerol-3-phosphate dehydrogenase subunit C|nr:ferredoxin [Alphaproteobacteria bacterium]